MLTARPHTSRWRAGPPPTHCAAPTHSTRPRRRPAGAPPPPRARARAAGAPPLAGARRGRAAPLPAATLPRPLRSDVIWIRCPLIRVCPVHAQSTCCTRAAATPPQPLRPAPRPPSHPKPAPSCRPRWQGAPRAAARPADSAAPAPPPGPHPHASPAEPRARAPPPLSQPLPAYQAPGPCAFREQPLMRRARAAAPRGARAAAACGRAGPFPSLHSAECPRLLQSRMLPPPPPSAQGRLGSHEAASAARQPPTPPRRPPPPPRPPGAGRGAPLRGRPRGARPGPQTARFPVRTCTKKPRSAPAPCLAQGRGGALLVCCPGAPHGPGILLIRPHGNPTHSRPLPTPPPGRAAPLLYAPPLAPAPPAGALRPRRAAVPRRPGRAPARAPGAARCHCCAPDRRTLTHFSTAQKPPPARMIRMI
jgi:hypothetical protein